MPKFLVGRDLDLFKSIARELVDTVIENTVVLYKINLNETKINIYGESLNKTWHKGVELFALIDKEAQSTQYEGFGSDTIQDITFKFDRGLLEERNIHPEIGDVVYFNNDYYEINNMNEMQFIGGLPVNTYSIVCFAFLVSRSSLNIEQRIS
jgi:hypothetical protein